jgi:asparagine synthase (glutamine-hydrolysing)
MCGIVGFWLASAGSSEQALSALRAMSDAIAHRGPDDSDQIWEAASGVGLGHRRLSIVDLSPDGRQPMVSASGRYVIVFNGEVYNFEEIRAQLSGATFRGHSDTEVMLAAIEAWGLDQAVARFVGMFAFALWDRVERRLSLVRDRLGVKPLYYARTARGIWFGSELKALVAAPGFECRLDESSLSDFLKWGYVPAPHTIYSQVYKLEPGYILQLDGAASPARKTCYWDLKVLAGSGDGVLLPDALVLDELDELLRSAVRLRMIADVSLGAFLSGGIDSSLVVALMQAQSQRPVRTFSIGSESNDYDESAAAARVARHLGTEHTTLVVTERDALDAVPNLAAISDEPFADSSQLPTFLIARLARRQVTVALTGDGGDETFGGYNRHTWGPRIWRWLRRVPAPLREQVRRSLAAHPAVYTRALGGLLPRSARPRLLDVKMQKVVGALGAASSTSFYEALRAQWPSPERLLKSATVPRDKLPIVATGDFAADMMLLDTLTYLPDDVLTKVDRATMAVALEARAPLLDHRVVTFGWRLPQRFKLRNGVGKWALRQLLYRYVPQSLVDRPKMGFAVPVAEWLRGPLHDWAADMLVSADSSGRFQPRVLDTLWRQHVTRRQDNSSLLWPVLMFQSWLNAQPALQRR